MSTKSNWNRSGRQKTAVLFILLTSSAAVLFGSVFNDFSVSMQMLAQVPKTNLEIVHKDSTQTPEQLYEALHPGYVLCVKRVDLIGFTKSLADKCGDIRTQSTCSTECAQLVAAGAANFSCCWETVLEGYEILDPAAAVAWRTWQTDAEGHCLAAAAAAA
eukprot:CAMPEP_0172170958 /NCGR_PEP_ID=MMETSP1050-20130122/11619_1 /TAXON_ID=233186 /ORGANISM="Cryptomonas curvata, Strain CCAP979/52" /LENGTH=159 /DNA_ID=CAMNT_0012842323 /DNA_START=37 /DNA_END=512 /DNA_ORIENTATION=-